MKLSSILRRSFAFSLPLVVLAIPLSCGGIAGDDGSGGSGAGGGSGGSTEPPDLCMHYAPASIDRALEYATAVCDHLATCCTADQVAAVWGDIDYASCRLHLQSAWFTAEAIAEWGRSNGGLTFDEEKFHECTAALTTAACGHAAPFDLINPVELCPGMWKPGIEPGGECLFALQCTTGRCLTEQGSAVGVCLPRVAAGEPCASTADCEVGHHCASGTCAAPLPDGAACTWSGECQSRTCQDGGSTPGTCVTVCEGGGPGPGPIDDVLDELVGSMRWVWCQRDNACNSCACGPDQVELSCISDLLFDALGLPELHALSAQGKLVIDQSNLWECLADLANDGCPGEVHLVCPDAFIGLVQDGEACSSDPECASRHCGDGACEPLPGEGDSCDGPCALGLYCQEQTCLSQKALGEACGSSKECAVGQCLGPADGPLACALACAEK